MTIDRDTVLTDIGALVAGLQVPLSMGMPMGAAERPYRDLLAALGPGFGYTNPEDVTAKLRTVVDGPPAEPSIAALIVDAPEPMEPDYGRRLVALALDNLTEAVANALDVCDAVEGPVVGDGPRFGTNLPELLSAALTAVAERVVDPERLVEHRPGSWEADHVRALAMVIR